MTLWGVIAGGRGTRFGEAKIFAVHRGRTFLEWMLDTIDATRDQHDLVAVGVARDEVITLEPNRLLVPDLTDSPGPAHSIARLAECAVATGHDLIFMPVDMLAVSPETLRRFLERLRFNANRSRDAVIVARAGERVHWVLGAVPLILLRQLVTGSESVNAVQSLLRLCPLDYLDVEPDELLDVNTRASLPTDHR